MSGETPFQIFERVLNASGGRPAGTALQPADRLSAIGLGNSLALVQLIVQLEEAFQIDLPPEALDTATFESVQTLWSVVSEFVET